LVPPYRDVLYPLNAFMHVLAHEEGTVDALHYGLFAAPDEGMAAAQQRSTDLILARLPPVPARLLDVGIGLGGLLRCLTTRGYDAEGIGPDPVQMRMVRERHGDAIKTVPVRFEDLDSPAPFDLVIFQESAQYIDARTLFEKAAMLTSRVVVVDEFALRPLSAPPALPDRTRFTAEASRAGFHVVEELDLSREAAPTIDYFLARLPRHRASLVRDLGLTEHDVDHLLISGRLYRDRYHAREYGYCLFDFRVGVGR
jgi:SAM-dependent methyltransferase